MKSRSRRVSETPIGFAPTAGRGSWGTTATRERVRTRFARVRLRSRGPIDPSAQPWTAVVDRRPPALWRASRVSRQAVAETPNETRCVVGRRFRPAADASDGSRTRSNEPRREKARTMVTPFPEVYRRPACVPGAAAKGRSLRQSARFTAAANPASFFQLKLECLSGKRTLKPIFGALDERRDQSMRLTADAKIGPN